MRAVINNKLFDTEKAKLIEEWNNGHPTSDFKHCSEDLYLTKNSHWFLDATGGALSKYAQPVGGGGIGGDHLIVSLTPEEALRWMEEHNCVDSILEHFKDNIKEA